ncbi:MAG: hypothetical protein KDA75_22525 [Planctomycetaceae bacterium]|nr:hypothetical protein [Planctomycetaceae bacterium]
MRTDCATSRPSPIRKPSDRRQFLLVTLTAFGLGRCIRADDAPQPQGTSDTPSDAVQDTGEADPSKVVIVKHRYTGEARNLSDVLAERGVKAGPEMQTQVVLELDDGRVLPILADWRGRAFYQDERLRDRKVTLIANRRSDLGYLQPLMVFTYDEQGNPQFTDYWCDVCSIPMYEIKPCECCQGDIRLRYTSQSPPDDVAIWAPEPQLPE